MIKDTLSKVEALARRIRTSDHKYKSELLALVEKLKAELAAQEGKAAENSAVDSFEASHPKLTETVNSLASLLSSLGI